MNVREFRRILAETILVPVLMLLALAGILSWQIHALIVTQRWVDHSDRVTAELQQLQRLIVDQETGLRGYQLTGSRAMLQPLHEAVPRIPAQFELIRRLTIANPGQQARLAELRDRYQIWLGFVEPILNAPDPTVFHALAANEDGKQKMDNVRATMDEMIVSEEELRERQIQTAEKQADKTLIIVFVSALVAGIVLAIFTWTRLRQVSHAYQHSLDDARRQAEEVLRGRQWFQTTLESIGDAVIACDVEGRIQFMNDVAAQLTGWEPGEAHGRPLEEVFRIINEATRATVENPVEKVRRLGTVVGLANHTLLIRKDETEIALDDSAAPIRDTRGAMLGIVLVFRDVTEQKRAEAALIASEKLAVAGRLAASIAHEIHNPLDSVANLHFLLTGEADPEKRAEYLRLAQQELGRTMQISRTMLSLYREPRKAVAVDLKDVAESVLLLLERRLGDHGMQVESDMASAAVQGFPAELRQVFTNLVLNAIDAAGDGGRIYIRIAPTPPADGRPAGALLEVTDNGDGIAPGAEKNLFQPFFTTKGEHGTGLGLWVSLGIVQKHGGDITIGNSTHPSLKGATVTVFFPTP